MSAQCPEYKVNPKILTNTQRAMTLILEAEFRHDRIRAKRSITGARIRSAPMRNDYGLFEATLYTRKHYYYFLEGSYLC